MAKFTEIFEDVTKQGTKIPTNLYLENGLYPIIDQGQSEIAGYTNQTEGLFTDIPAIIFGDHTRIIKYVDTPCFLGADGVKLLKAKDNNANYKYLYYALCHADIPNTGYNRHFKWLKEIDIPEYLVEEQNSIVAQLEKIDILICLRQQQLSKLEELVKSRFIELFGDPIDNPLNWKVANFQDVVYFQEGPGVRNWQFRDNGIKLINIRNLVDDNLVLENTSNYLSEQEVEEKYKHFLLEVGDYVMASSGVTWGKIAEVFEEHLPLCLNTSIIRLRPYDEQIISKKYLFHYIKGDAFRMQISRLITGSAQPNFGPTHLKKIAILVPPIELQEAFAAFVEQTDKSKFEIQQSLEKLETLKKALMQKYFG